VAGKHKCTHAKKQAEDSWESNIDWLTDGRRKSKKMINNLSKQKLQVRNRKYLGMRNYIDLGMHVCSSYACMGLGFRF
jgi:hypothetical protein